MEYDSAYMHRLRVRLDQNEASTIATALIGGTMVPEPAVWSEHARLLAYNINRHWVRSDYAKFPQLTPAVTQTSPSANLARYSPAPARTTPTTSPSITSPTTTQTSSTRTYACGTTSQPRTRSRLGPVPTSKHSGPPRAAAA